MKKENYAELISRFTGKSSRDVFGDILCELADADPRIVALSADVSESVRLNDFKKNWPDRFFNFGIAEQNMMGAAAGMARSGLHPFVSVYAIFAALRALEFVRTDIAYPKLPVRLCVSHSGISLGQGGPTHNSLEDLAIMRAIPHMTVVVPADGISAALCIKNFETIPGPVYFRMNRFAEKPVYRSEISFDFAKINKIKEGKGISILACGASVGNALQAVQILEETGISAALYDVHMLKPFDEVSLKEIAARSELLITVEEHNVIGGLGGAVAESLSAIKHTPRLVCLGIPDCFPSAGDYVDIIHYYGLDGVGIAERIKGMV
ncbi:MAG: transketolase family protein [Anaerolineaceae bacterium]|jgi:transketolase|nr:MAG: transketolase family protein [Anaerolineaceae bacterium]